MFRTSNSDFIQKCGLDAYFFLRYLRLLLKLFIPLAMVILPILLPINAVGGRGDAFRIGNYTHSSAWTNVTGLNQLAWGNVRPTQTRRYWAHLFLAIGVIVYSCYVFFDELRGYIRLRQAYLTSPQHRLRASATTVLVSAIPKKWCTAEALDGLYDVFPGGIRNIWINRNFDDLSEKVKTRNKLAKKLESAETDLIKKVKKANIEQLAKEAKRAGKKKSKAEKAEDKKRQDQEGSAMASKKGVSTGNPHQVSHSIGEALDGNMSSTDSSRSSSRSSSPENQKRKPFVPIPIVGEGIDKVGHEISNLGRTVFGGIRNVKKGVDNELNTTQGFQAQQIHDSPQIPQMDGSPNPNPPRESTDRLFDPNSPSVNHARNTSLHNNTSSTPVRDSAIKEDKRAENSTASGERKDEEQSDGTKSRFAFLKFWESEELPRIEYPISFDGGYDSVSEGDPLWKKYIKPEDRDTMRLPIFGKKWLGWIPFVGKKVDTIEHCRRELARLNTEIEADQKDPTRYPLLNSAFIQFNHQVAAHMACQAVSHHMPNQMAPRAVEISPDDVIWDNLSVKWWERYIRTGGIIVLVVGLVIGWAFPVAFTGLLSNVSDLANTYPSWLGWLHKIPGWFISPIQGVLPQLLLAILLALLPVVMRFLARLQGHATGMSVELAVQDFYFFFLFVQVFLVLTLSSGAGDVITQIKSVGAEPQSIPSLLASKLPQASNYFFSYLLLQALSTSAGTLVQVGALAGWFLLGPLLDSTARQKWSRQLKLPNVKWGTFFPVYTNLAVIGIIYSVISPLILIFNIVTFSLFWFVYRYNTLYVTKFRFDTGGLLFPTAVNQLFTGLYVMELCLVGLFFIVRGVNEEGKPEGVPCYPQAIIMIIVLILTILYQWLLNRAFSPLFRYLPITLEDDAVIRDEEFARAQQKKFNLAEEEQEGDDINDVLAARERREEDEDQVPESIELHDIEKRRSHRLDPRKLGDNLASIVPGRVSWADRSRRRSQWEHENDGQGAVDVNSRSPDLGAERRRRTKRAHEQHRLRIPGDSEAQEPGGNNIGEALFAGIHDEIEDLTPDERDKLVQRAFQHEALRARRPVIWIPRDDLGVSNDEIMRTKKLSSNIWISNEYTGLDSKARVVYSKSPPDFSEVDLIEL